MHKPLIRASLAFVFAGLLAGVATAQPAAEPDRYVVITYIKVLPGQDDAYRAYLTSTSKNVFKEIMAANSSFVAWSSARVMYQGLEHGGQYDYVAASVFAGSPPEPGANMDAIVQKATGMSPADAQKKLASMRTVVGSEVLRRRAGTGATGTFKEGDFRVVTRWKIADGMGDEFVEMARTMTEPLMKARVAGGEINGWSMWTRVFPAGGATSYDAMGVTYWKDLASAIKGLDATKGLEAFTKAHPGKNYAAYVSNGRDYSKLQERSLMQVVALLER